MKSMIEQARHTPEETYLALESLHKSHHHLATSSTELAHAATAVCFGTKNGHFPF